MQGVGQAVPGVGQAVQGIQAFEQLFGPKGAVTQGDVGGIAKNAQSLYSAGSGMVGQGAPQANPIQGMSLNPSGANTLSDKFTMPGGQGMTKDQFDTLPPGVRQALLRTVMGR